MGKRTSTATWDEKTKRWKINVQKDGQRRSFYSSTPGRNGQREAHAKADAWLDENITDQNTRVDKLFDDYIEELKQRTSKSHWMNEESRGRTWIKPIIGHLKISSLNEQHLITVMTTAYNKKKLSKKSLSNLRALLFSFIKYCRNRKATAFHPEDIPIPKAATVKPHTILQPEHLITLFTVDTTLLHGKRVHDECINAYRLQVLLGLRPGELLGLMCNDRDGDVLRLSRAINVHGEITTGKNENAIRPIGLSETARKIWDDQVSKCKSIYLFEGLLEQTYRKRLKRYCESNGIPSIPPYELRHTFVSVAKNLNEGQIKALVGHSRNMDTFGTYGHEVRGELSKTASSLEALFKDILTPQEEKGGEV